MPRRENASDRRQRREGKTQKKKRVADKAAKKEASAEDALKNQEQSIEDILKEMELEAQAKKGPTATEVECSQPSARLYGTLSPHPAKDQLLLFGGEFMDGQKTRVYNDLYTYTPSKRKWKQMKVPNTPRPRSAHSAVVTQGSDASLFVFGGEFTSPTGSQFYHYAELWRLPLTVPLAEMEWEHIEAKGGPGPRSGHRMAVWNKRLVVFGGFQDNNRSTPRYFSDAYIFDLGTYKWSKLTFPAVMMSPDPRSAVQLSACAEGIMISGGYSMTRNKGEVYSGKQHADSWLLSEAASPEAEEGAAAKWQFTRLKPGGADPNYRSGAVMVQGKDATSKAFSFGGCEDEEDEETISSVFHDTLYAVTVGPKPAWHVLEPADGANAPVARINAQLAVSAGKLYIYGGSVEVGTKQVTLSDLYSLDVGKKAKAAAWECHHTNDSKTDMWLESSSDESSSDDDSDEEVAAAAAKKKKKAKNKGKGPNPLKARLLATPNPAKTNPA